MTGFMVWTEEEVRYLQAVLSWDPGKADEIYDTRSSYHSARESATMTVAAAELRLLVLGAQGCGKTTLLNRFGEGAFAPEPHQEHIPRVSLSGLACCHSLRLPTQDGEDRVYSVDVLELPAANNDDYLRQAVRTTDAAIVVYDVTSQPSFDIAETLLRTRLPAALSPKRPSEATHEACNITNNIYETPHEYAFLLLGNKVDLCRAGSHNQPSSELSSSSSPIPIRRRRRSRSDTTGDQTQTSASTSGSAPSAAAAAVNVPEDEHIVLPFDAKPIQAGSDSDSGILRPQKQRQKYQHDHSNIPSQVHRRHPLPQQALPPPPSHKRRVVSYTEAQRLASSSNINTSNSSSFSSHHHHHHRGHHEEEEDDEYPPPPPYQGSSSSRHHPPDQQQQHRHRNPLRCSGFLEASALEGDNVAEAFQVIGREIIRIRRNRRRGDGFSPTTAEGDGDEEGNTTAVNNNDNNNTPTPTTRTTAPGKKKLKIWLQRVVSAEGGGGGGGGK